MSASVVPFPDPRVEVRGAAWLEDVPGSGVLPHRLPAAARAQFPDGFVALCDEQPSGVRLRFRTAADRVTLDVSVLRTVTHPLPPAAPGPWDVLVGGALVAQPEGCGAAGPSGTVALDPLTGATTARPGPRTTVTLALRTGVGPTDGRGDEPADVEVWLPTGETVVLHALRADAPVEPPATVVPAAPRWVHHGSSISHGAAAASPATTWPAVAARRAGLDLVSLGFSGNAVLDPFTARAMRDAPADLLSVKVGINVVNKDCFRLRAFVPAVHGFLDTVREGHLTTPLVVMSPLLCPLVEDTPGPTFIDPASPPDAPVFATRCTPADAVDGRLTLSAIRDVLADVVAARRAAGDAALTYVDGRDLYGPENAERLPMRDRLHPDGPAHVLIGERAAPLLRAALGGAVPSP
ncbi:SGNH/GDSL hydrolase family protein [Cellulomonas marina]|uniref:GDSL-like Lipase/Acylhydrolase family protein n=1 Tax=Cellulomonas marina TaxID=988821 RepID=A0A1I0WR24_9CELL|nr:SGNH/GDSL hydrolase family protein [Cellulomonas marina]GIG27827.1 lipase [Cellulomonas marina]SFA91205.1 GDSL-like Lipase/Acylhydrolase family protein [Cellulomonas marina]